MATLIWIVMCFGVAGMALAMVYAAFLIIRFGYSLIEVIEAIADL